MRKINVITLGCSKNLVDSEVLMRQCQNAGIEVVHDEDGTDADIVILNTCGFIHDAKQESIDTILDYIQAKEEGEIDQVFVMGCLSERYKDSLAKEIPEVDHYFGVTDINEILTHLKIDYKEELVGERFISTPSHYAYLKISEGCDRSCSFCAIPLIRGKHESKSIDALVKESQYLAKQGVKELILIAQDLTYYGIDLYGKSALANLLTELCKVEGIEWIRLHYAYPAKFPLDVLEVMKKESKICKYLDIPLQHINTEVLKNMRRGIDREKTTGLLRQIRTIIPDIAVRTTMLVGHPGETEKAFNELKEFIKEYKFERLGVFTYSEEEDTWGATNLNDEIPSDIKEQRADELMLIQQEISARINAERIGKTYKVIIDRKEAEYYIGRTEYDSPDVDTEVLIKNEQTLSIGHFYVVHIESADDFDLFGHVVSKV